MLNYMYLPGNADEGGGGQIGAVSHNKLPATMTPAQLILGTCGAFFVQCLLLFFYIYIF